MSYIFFPRHAILLNLPVRHRAQIFSGGKRISNPQELHAEALQLQTAACEATKRITPAFTPERLKDFDERPTIAVIADGATLRTTSLTEEARALQKVDKDEAFKLGQSLAKKGWRVALPGCEGLCESIIEGIIAEKGEFIVATDRRSLKYAENDAPFIPTSNGNGLYIITNTPAESKSVLFGLSDSFIYFKGGLNTFDLFTDDFVLEQTSMHNGYRIEGDPHRKLVVLNDDGFWNPVLGMTEHMLAEGLADENRRPLIQRDGAITDEERPAIIVVAHSIEDAIAQTALNIKSGDKWKEFESHDNHVFIPSDFFGLATTLSRRSIMRTILPVTPEALKAELSNSRKLTTLPEAIDPELLEAISRDCVAVYCGSRDGLNPAHKETAREVGALLRKMGKTLVYGGSVHGIMGAVADGYVQADCESHKPYVIAVTPFPFLLGTSTAANEGFNEHITLTLAVPGMQERKMLMTSLSDTSVMLTGGWGSLDEAFEDIRLNFLNVTPNRKVIVVNTGGYWDKLPDLFAEAIKRGYMRKEDLNCVSYVKTVPELRTALQPIALFSQEKTLAL